MTRSLPPDADPPRVWQRMLSGRSLNLIDPSPLDIDIRDIALGLSRNTRWNGQTHGGHGWSVAQHALFVVDILQRLYPESPSWVLLAALLHDAPEYVTHDLITPLKAVVGDVFLTIENRLQEAVHQAFGLPTRLPHTTKAQIKRADLIAAATEAVQLAGFNVAETKTLLKITAPPLTDVTLTPMPSSDAGAAFLKRFDLLYRSHRHALMAQASGKTETQTCADGFRF
ncbi:MAG: HD family hydrolase [Rhodospirillaceae bacterium]|nr:HD family hydrolase [Rhodospirillaceae bacterium]